LRRGNSELAVTAAQWASDRNGLMPWGKRIATVADPDGNPVALANAASG
jgi:hypothetical protein